MWRNVYSRWLSLVVMTKVHNPTNASLQLRTEVMHNDNVRSNHDYVSILNIDRFFTNTCCQNASYYH